jgi:lysozyme
MSSGFEQRRKGKLPAPGPYLAEITNHLDPTYMGGVEVVLSKGVPSSVVLQGNTYVARYLSPFYGATSIRYEGNNPGEFNDVQKSYGMWMVPPDVGTTVLVIFVDGDPNQCYWIGCVPDIFQNQMIPGIAASESIEATQEQKKKYGTAYLPSAELHKKSQKLDTPNIKTIKKPVHPFADRLLSQGLLLDDIRGVTSSSARREVPSSVFGISTPGPLDTSAGAKRGKIGYTGNTQAPVSRLGGSTFVMDDGDINGDNELVRIRTRTGHQILMHNTKDLIYIANAGGTSWIEMTSEGKLDIYAADSVSIHTEADFNFRADRNINMEAGGSFNVSVGGDHHIDVTGNYTVNSSQAGKLDFGSTLDINAVDTTKLTSSSDLHIKATGSLYQGSSADVHVISSGIMYQTSGGEFNVKAGGTYKETAPKIHMNGPAASAATAPTSAATADSLRTFSLPNRSVGAGWENGNAYKTDDLISIMKRVPTHEPWPDHESTDPVKFSSANTDAGTASSVGGSASVTFNKAPNVQGTPPSPTGDTAADNLAAFLWMIRVCEGTSGPDGYKTMFTGKLFTSFADHPRIANKGGGITSTAAGAYQFLSSTWDMCKKALSLPDFSPHNQDLGAIYLLQMQNAVSDIKAGNFTKAISKTNRIWASLPGSPYNQHPKTLPVALALYKQAGGTAIA